VPRQNGSLVGVVSAKLNALKLMVATNGDIAQNVNFAIKSSIATSFLEANECGEKGGRSFPYYGPNERVARAVLSVRCLSGNR
jgi:serine protease Do